MTAENTKNLLYNGPRNSKKNLATLSDFGAFFYLLRQILRICECEWVSELFKKDKKSGEREGSGFSITSCFAVKKSSSTFFIFYFFFFLPANFSTSFICSQTLFLSSIFIKLLDNIVMNQKRCSPALGLNLKKFAREKEKQSHNFMN